MISVELALAWLRLELAQRWRSLVVLALLVALSTGTVLTVLAGARRGASAVDRLIERTHPATVVARINTSHVFDWDRIRTLPEVQALSTFANFSGFSVDEAPASAVNRYIPTDPAAMRDPERPVVLAGRLADPRRWDEAVVTAAFVRTYGRGVGDTVTLRLFSAQQVDTALSAIDLITPTRPEGPVVPVRIVGVVRSPWYSDQVGEPGRLFPSPGLSTRYPTSVSGGSDEYELWALVRLRRGDADIPAFRADLARISGSSDVDVVPRSVAVGHIRDVARFEAACLLALGIAALVAALVLVGQSIVRHVTASSADLMILRTLGMTRTQSLVAAAFGPVVAGVAGSAAGLVAAVAASRWMPFGVAATMEPAPGVDADWLVLVPGAVVTVALVAGCAASAGWLVPGRQPRAARQQSTLVRAITAWRLPVPVLVGSRFVLEPRHAGTASRTGLLASVVGVLGVLGAFTFSGAVTDAGRNPARFGQGYHAVVVFGILSHEDTPPAPVLETLRADPDVEMVADAPCDVGHARNQPVLTFGLQSSARRVVVPTAGRPPGENGEVLLAPATAARLGAAVGATISLSGGSDTPPLRLRVTGLGFVPQTVINDYDDGAWVTESDYRRMFGANFFSHQALVVLRPGADAGVVVPRVQRSLAASVTRPPFLVRPPRLERQSEVRDLRVLPLVLGTFLAALGVAAAGHWLWISVRRRRWDVAVLRALGMTPGQSRIVVLTQSAILAITGLIIGIPLGIAAGRVVWRVVADATPLAYRPPTALGALLTLVPASLAVAGVLAAPAAIRISRQGIAHVLRTE